MSDEGERKRMELCVVQGMKDEIRRDMGRERRGEGR